MAFRQVGIQLPVGPVDFQKGAVMPQHHPGQGRGGKDEAQHPAQIPAHRGLSLLQPNSDRQANGGVHYHILEIGEMVRVLVLDFQDGFPQKGPFRFGNLAAMR